MKNATAKDNVATMPKEPRRIRIDDETYKLLVDIEADAANAQRALQACASSENALLTLVVRKAKLADVTWRRVGQELIESPKQPEPKK